MLKSWLLASESGVIVIYVILGFDTRSLFRTPFWVKAKEGLPVFRTCLIKVGIAYLPRNHDFL